MRNDSSAALCREASPSFNFICEWVHEVGKEKVSEGFKKKKGAKEKNQPHALHEEEVGEREGMQFNRA